VIAKSSGWLAKWLRQWDLWLNTLQDQGEIPMMYVSGDGTGVPMRQEELEGAAANSPTVRPKPRSQVRLRVLADRGG